MAQVDDDVEVTTIMLKLRQTLKGLGETDDATEAEDK
jgi:hypothetical protein